MSPCLNCLLANEKRPSYGGGGGPWRPAGGGRGRARGRGGGWSAPARESAPYGRGTAVQRTPPPTLPDLNRPPPEIPPPTAKAEGSSNSPDQKGEEETAKVLDRRIRKCEANLKVRPKS